MRAQEFVTEKQDACYHKVRSRYKIWPSAYASGALVQCRKKGAANWGNKSKNEDVEEGSYSDMRQADRELRSMFAPSAAFRSGDRVTTRFSDTTQPVTGVVAGFDARTGKAVVQDAEGKKYFVHAQNLTRVRDRSLAEQQQLDEGLKQKAAAIVMSLGLLGPMAAQNAQAFDLGDVARALPMIVGAVNQNRGLDNKDIMRRVITQEINQYRVEERQFDRWFAHQLRDPRDRDAFRLAAQEKEFWQARAMNMQGGQDAAKAAAAVTYYQTVRNSLAEKYGISVPR